MDDHEANRNRAICRQFEEDLQKLLKKYWEKDDIDYIDITAHGIRVLAMFGIIAIHEQNQELPLEEIANGIDEIASLAIDASKEVLEQIIETYDELHVEENTRQVFVKREGNVIHLRTPEQMNAEY